MKYQLKFQYRPRGSERPLEGMSSGDLEFISNHAAPVIPNIGDHVFLVHTSEATGVTFDGKVASRLFTYLGTEQCTINIVVEEVAIEEFGTLVKE